MTSRLNSLHHSFACNILTNYFIVFKTLSQRTFCLLLLFEHSLSLIKSQELLESLLIIFFCNHKNYNFLACGWFKNVLFSTNSFAKLLSDSLFLDSLLLDSLLSDSLISQSHSNIQFKSTNHIQSCNYVCVRTRLLLCFCRLPQSVYASLAVF